MQALIVVETVAEGGLLLILYPLALGFGSPMKLPGAARAGRIGMKSWFQDVITLFCGLIGPDTVAPKAKTLPDVAKNVGRGLFGPGGRSFSPRAGVVVIWTVAVGMWIPNGALNATAGSIVLVA